MKNLLAVISALIISLNASAQTSEYLTLYKHYEGKLGNKEAVLDIVYYDTDVMGVFYHKRTDTSLRLHGTVIDGEIELVDEASDKTFIKADTAGGINGKCLFKNLGGTANFVEDYSKSMKFNGISATLEHEIPFHSDEDSNAAAKIAVYYHYLQPAEYKGEAVAAQTKELFGEKFNTVPRQSVEGDFFNPEPYPLMNFKNLLQTSKNSFVENVTRQLNDDPNISSFELLREEVNNQYVTYNSNGLVSIINSCYSYMGGAHGMYAKVPVIFDLESGRTLDKEDIFKPGTDAKIISLIVKYFVDNGKASANDDDEEGIFTDQVFVDNNIGIENGFLVFYYQPYDIDSYIAGIYTAKVRILDLLPYIIDNSPIKRMLK